jgi:benzoyl-CoA reductase/2-hydroxyglutaryl-CoA dehydratase subunit BcrC/BadD/HgdB
MGYSADLCSYARADIGCSKTNGGPIDGLPKPDMLICCNNICGTVTKWYEIQARNFNVPLFILDTPFCHDGYTPEIHQYVRKQIDEMILFLEKVCNKKFDYDKMIEVGKLSIEAQRLWQAVLDTTTHKPAPMTAFDAFFHLALIVTLRGKQLTIDYYKTLLDEMNERINTGISAVPNEKYRLLWDNLPVWYRTKWMSDKFAEHDACLVADTYTSAWCGSIKYINENDFVNTMAEAYTRIYLNISITDMTDSIIDMIKKYDVDGFVMHSNRSCKPYSFGQYDIAKIIREKTGIPILMLDADMVDERYFSESQVENRINAFMEMLKTKKQNH